MQQQLLPDCLTETERLLSTPCHDNSIGSEMLLFISEEERELFSHETITNPFRLTHHPRILGAFDIPSNKRELMNAIVDIVSSFSDEEGKIERVLSSGFVVSPPTCPFIFIFTCQHGGRDLIDDVSNRYLRFDSMVALVESHRWQRPVIKGMYKYSVCEIVDFGVVEDSHTLVSNPQSDWMLLKMEKPKDDCLDDNCYFIPSPSRIPIASEENIYNACLLSIPSAVSDLDEELVSNISEMTKDEISSFFELDIKSASYGNLIDIKDGTIYYNSGSFIGSSGGAVTDCNQPFEEWSTFKQNVSLSRFVYGIHVGVGREDDKYVNRCCSVTNWFPSFLKHVYDPYKHCFDEESRKFIENNKVLID